MSSGALAEQAAAKYLQKQGLMLVTSNYRCRFGEIDLIVQDGDALVFVEVRQRRNANFGGASASIDRYKQAKLIKAAQHYLSSLSHTPPCRFDAVLMSSCTGSDIEWLKNAFSA
jgi:putative endonuclease